jgi:hypothetical protein
MSNLLNKLGLEEDRIEWYHLAACKNMPINWFYDNYESNKVHAEQADQICMSCPVATFCLQEGIKNKEFGVWGGVYLNLGRVDKDHNSHKTPEVWKKLRKKHGKNTI